MVSKRLCISLGVQEELLLRKGFLQTRNQGGNWNIWLLENFTTLHSNFYICSNFQRIKMKFYIPITFRKSYLNFSFSYCLHSFQECFSWQTKSRIYDWNNNIRDKIYPNIHTSFLYLTTSPLAISSAEIIWQHIFSTEVAKIRQDEKFGRFTSSLYIRHTKAMTALTQHGSRCLYVATDFYSVLIVRSASWLKLKSSHFEKCCEENFICERFENVVPRLNKHNDIIEWIFMKIAPPPNCRKSCCQVCNPGTNKPSDVKVTDKHGRPHGGRKRAPAPLEIGTKNQKCLQYPSQQLNSE